MTSSISCPAPVPSFTTHSPWVNLQKEVRQSPETRQTFIRKIEELFNGKVDHTSTKVLTFFTSFTDEDAQITDDDAEMIESILAVEHPKGKLVLVINSPGGQALAAERIVNVCREYSGGDFEVIVPHMAKSAATMICFGASAINMSKTAELGPVDPQVPYADDTGTKRWISAEEYVRSYEKLIADSTAGKATRIEPYLQQLQRFDARYIEKLKSAQSLSKDISVRLLKSSMMSKCSDKEILRKADVFLSQKKTNSHGRMINYEGAIKCGLNVKIIDLRSELWNSVWELFVRSDWCVNHKCKKLIESNGSSINF